LIKLENNDYYRFANCTVGFENWSKMDGWTDTTDRIIFALTRSAPVTYLFIAHQLN